MAKTLDDNEFKKCLTYLTKFSPVNQVKLKDILATCKNDSGKIDIAYETLSKCLKSKSSKGRLKGLTLVSEFFQRSAVFRRLFCDNLQDHLGLLIDLDPVGSPLPPLKSDAKLLQSEALRLLQLWCEQYGEGHRGLFLASDHVKRVLKIPNLSHGQKIKDISADLSKEEKTRKAVEKRVLATLNDLKDEMNRCLSEMNSCFSLLIPRLTQVLGNANSVEQVDLATHGIPVAMSAGRSIAIEVVVNLTPSVLPTHNNQPIRQTLVDCGSLVTKRYLPQIHKLINVATKVKGNEQLLIELNNWKSQFLDAQIKIAELKLSAAVPLGNDIESDSDENEFEEVLPEECLIEDYESPSTSYS